MKLGFVHNLLIAVLMAIFATAAAGSALAQPENLPPISTEMLRNATYSGIYDAPITLTDGRYEGEPFVAGDASRPIVEYIDGAEVYGDLDGDGVDDAVVFLVENSGGTGNFVYVAAQLNRDGQPLDAGAVWIEDRIQVKSAAIEDGQVALGLIAPGPGDGACCPSYRTGKRYVLQDGLLAELPGAEEESIKVTAADLADTSWTLLELDKDQPALADAEVTISFHDGQFSGFGGCNTYNGAFTLSDDNPFLVTIGPIAATQMACPEPLLSQESAYFAALQQVSRWGFAYGRLALAYTDDQGNNVPLLFAPQGAPEATDLDALVAHPWQWVSFTSPVEQFDVETPASYKLRFNVDGIVDILADCNTAIAAYGVESDDAGSLSLTVAPKTETTCPPESRGAQFLKLLGGAARFFFQDGQLYIDLFADGGAMAFAPAASADSVPASTADSGPVAIVGEAGSANFYASPDTFPEPVVALIDVTNAIAQQPRFASVEGQILGAFDTGMFPLPAKYSINLPIRPTGASLDLDNNGMTDAGVQVFALIVANNFTGDSYLQQLDQSGLSSYLTDLVTGAITEGAFVVYAPDANQSFPSGYGADVRWFTADDPSAPLMQGYTVVRLSADGQATVDRATEPVVDTIERQEVASPDFSQQGILESYNSLIDVLKQRYAYTDLRGLDWEQIRAQYLPEVEAADSASDTAAYFVTLKTLAHSIRDAHVAAIPGANVEAIVADATALGALISGNLGADTIAVADQEDPAAGPAAKTVVSFVGEDTPAAEAGWAPGAEIVSIDGQPVAERYASLPLIKSVGTEEGAHVQLAPLVLRFPISQTVVIGYRLPDSAEVLTATMTAGDYSWDATTPPATESPLPISYRQLGDTAVLKWDNFADNMPVKIAVLEEALRRVQGSESPGVILDMRGNTGGAAALYMTMASYFFASDQPMPSSVFDWYYYDEVAGGLVKEYAANYPLSAPKPELAYTGPLVVLVDQNCASACEYFSQHLQTLGRATVVGQYSTEGAGGPIDRIKLPGGLMFQYTIGRTTFAETEEPNLEAKGVVPDVRVPVTLETEQAKLAGEDPVMDAALAELDRLAASGAELGGTTWQWVVAVDASGAMTAVDTPGSYTIAFAEDGTVAIQADCNQASGEYITGEDGALIITLGPVTLAACPEGSRSDAFLGYLGAVQHAEVDGAQLVLTLASAGDVIALALETVTP
jgi:C-terminal processing protease CtpA/Prc